MKQHVLSPVELAILEALLESMIPSDHLGPGASEAGVPRYVVQRLAGPYRRYRAIYAAGLARLDAEADARHGLGFAELAPGPRDELVRAAELRHGDGFFELVLAHAMEGMFGDPEHGGNANFAGWELMRYQGPRYVWTALDQQLGTTGV